MAFLCASLCLTGTRPSLEACDECWVDIQRVSQRLAVHNLLLPRSKRLCCLQYGLVPLTCLFVISWLQLLVSLHFKKTYVVLRVRPRYIFAENHITLRTFVWIFTHPSHHQSTSVRHRLFTEILFQCQLIVIRFEP